MRLVGVSLLVAWSAAWSVAPRGEPLPPTSLVGGVACAGGDQAALAWLEVAAGGTASTLHVALVDEADRIIERRRLPVGLDALSFQLVAAGDGQFVLAVERHLPLGHGVLHRLLELHRLAPGLEQGLPSLDLGEGEARWQLAAAVAQPFELAVAIEGGGELPDRLVVLDPAGRFVELPGEPRQPRWLVGAGGGHVVTYAHGRRDGTAVLTVAPGRAAAWTAQLSRPSCFHDGDRPPTVTSVVGLRGGYARLSRRGAEGCVDGLRDGAPFAHRRLPIAGIAAARLDLADDGTLGVHEHQEAQLTRRRLRLPADAGPALVDTTSVNAATDDEAVRYRVFGGTGRRGTTALATRVDGGETQVLLERSGGAKALLLAPARRYQPDYRPWLRWLALLPLALLGLGALGAHRLHRRVGGVVPLPDASPLAAGPSTVAGRLAIDADAPAGSLSLRRGDGLLRLFIEGATVLRASDLRPRSQPRGDAIDVAGGAQVIASGSVEPAATYRELPQLRARAGDLVIVGCTLEEARRLTQGRLARATLLVALAGTAVLALIR